MDSVIILKRNNKEVQVQVISGEISKENLRDAFLLEAEVPVALYTNGIMLASKNSIYNLGKDCNGQTYQVEWEEERRSRASTRMSHDSRSATPFETFQPVPPYVFDEELAEDLSKRLFFIPIGQKALLDPKDPFIPSVPIKDGEINGGCVSPISTRAAVTYAHKSHAILTEFVDGKDAEANRHSLVEIRNCQNSSIRHQMKVIKVDANHDFVILQSVGRVEIFQYYPYALRCPKNFEWFVGLGLSHETDAGQHITHRNGKICSNQPDYRGRYLASSSIDAGDSGGPCYSADKALIGIMVSSTTTDPRLNLEYDCEIVEEEIKDASSNPADTWIAPANLISEAYKAYLVKQGILPVRAEKELGEPKPKRRAINRTQQ